MEILGLGFVALCMFMGSYIGVLVGKILGINDNVGGVGFAMLFLVLITNYLEKKGGAFSEGTSRGVKFLGAIYIPVVVAMSAIQNVVTAFSSGTVALLAGGIATIGSLMLIPVITKLVAKK